MEQSEKVIPVNPEQRKKLIEYYIKRMKNYFMPENKMTRKGCYRYVVRLMGQKFAVHMSDEELANAIDYAIDILEEMKNINNAGMHKREFEALVAEMKGKTMEKLLSVLNTREKIATEKMEKLVIQIEEFRKVNDLCAIFITRPVFGNELLWLYSTLVDRFDDAKWYLEGGFFLLCAIMKINSYAVLE